MEKYIALVVKRNDFIKHYVLSTPNESKESFINRVRNCYIKPYDIPYFDVEVFELGPELPLDI